MSFYGSVYYQLIDAFNRFLVDSTKKNNPELPKMDIIVDTERQQAPGRQGVLGIKTGNRWLGFSKNTDNTFTLWHGPAGNGSVFETEDTEIKSGKEYYTKDDAGNYIPWKEDFFEDNITYYESTPLKEIYGFQKVEDMYTVTVEAEQDVFEAIEAALPEPLNGTKAITFVFNDEGTETKPSAIYEYNEEKEEWIVFEDSPLADILTPDDYFITTEISGVDAAGHLIPGAKKYYKMPKSDVAEEIDNLWASVEDIEEINQEQQELIDDHEEYVGDWSVNRGYIWESYDEEGNPTESHWVPTISMAIGPISKLIDGTESSDLNRAYYDHKGLSLVTVIGNLTALLEDLKQDVNFGLDADSDVTDINLIQVIRYLKNTLIAANTTAISGHTGQLINLTDDINRLTADTLALQGRADNLEAKDIEIEADIDAINDPSTGILITAKNYTDSLANGAVKANTDAITAINNPSTGILANAKSYTDNLANGAVKDNTNAITAINDSETGILAKANKYTDELANGAVANNANAIIAINDGETGILKTANNYTDAEIDKLNYTDSAVADGQYVYSVNETNGIIAVEHKALPTYTLTSGSTNGTVAFNGSDVIVKGLGTAAYSNTDAFDASGAAATAKSEAIAEAKTETENQVKALAEGSVADNTAAIEALELLLQDYNTLVEKVAELEDRIAALEPITEEPTPEEEGSETTT